MAKSSIRPGCGNSAMSGGLLPWTRGRIRVSKDWEASVNLIVMPEDFSNAAIACSKPLDWSPPKPYMISICLSPAPPSLSPPPPPPPSSLRQAEANSIATAATAIPWNNLRHRILSPFR